MTLAAQNLEGICLFGLKREEVPSQSMGFFRKSENPYLNLSDAVTSDAARRRKRSGSKGVVARFKKLQWSHRGPELDAMPFHLRHKRQRLARLSEFKRLHLLGVRSESSVYRALVHKLDIVDPSILDIVRKLKQLHFDITHATEQLKRHRLAIGVSAWPMTFARLAVGFIPNSSQCFLCCQSPRSPFRFTESGCGFHLSVLV